MAEEFNDNENKTEEPTQKRLEEALKRGDVVKSQEVNTWFVVAGGALVLMAFSGTMGKDLSATMRGLIANAHDIIPGTRHADQGILDLQGTSAAIHALDSQTHDSCHMSFLESNRGTPN